MSEVDITFLDEKHFLGRQKKFQGKFAEELSCAITNFYNAMSFFENSKEEQFRRSGLVRREKQGVLAVDQHGSKKKHHILFVYIFMFG